MNRVALSAIIGVATLIPPSTFAEPASSPRADALELLFIDGQKPIRLDLRVEVDGKSVPAIWDDAFAKLFAYFDRDGDGALSVAEAGRLPSAFAVRQLLWGQLTSFTGAPPRFAELDTNGDGKVARDELADYFRRSGLGGVLVGVGKSPSTDALTGAILNRLDTNKDGQVNEAEWKQAAKTLRPLDANDDELIGPGELVERATYPGSLGSILMSAPAPNGATDSIVDRLPFVVLPLRTNDRHWASIVAERRKATTSPAMDDLLARRSEPPAATWRARFDADKLFAGSIESVGEKAPESARLVLATGATRFELRSDEGKLASPIAATLKRYAAEFAELDTDSNGSLSETELAVPKAGSFKQLARAADRNADGTLSGLELQAWLDLQEQMAKGHVLLTVIDHGNGLFEVLDTDRDGAISVRELRTAWDRLKSTGCIVEGKVERLKLPRQLLAVISRGHPKTSPGKPVRPGPAWFQAMDRNGDGDVSKREFTGPASVFEKLDLDKDELLSSHEATQARSVDKTKN